MMGRTHLGSGLLAGAAAPLVGLSGPEGIAAWTALALGAVAPDLDSGAGLITKPSDWLPEVIPVPGWVDGLAGTVGRVVRAVFGHRGLLHYPLLAVALALTARWLAVDWLAWFAVGYGLHLGADALTRAGVPALGPLSTRKVGLLPRAIRIRTGGIVEKALFVLVWGGLFWLAVPDDWKGAIL